MSREKKVARAEAEPGSDDRSKRRKMDTHAGEQRLRDCAHGLRFSSARVGLIRFPCPDLRGIVCGGVELGCGEKGFCGVFWVLDPLLWSLFW
jgi:hypothetical protein